MEIYILTIVHEYGINVSAYSSSGNAMQDAARFCKEYWQDTFGAEDVPDVSDEEIVSRYFQENMEESFSIVPISLDERCYG